MINRTKIYSAISAVLLFGIVVMMLMFNNCGKSSSCDGKKCKVVLGLNPKVKPSERDSIFTVNNPEKATKFNVFIESSLSMDGYVNGYTKFKTTLHRVIGQVIADVLDSDTAFDLNYINSSILKQKGSPKHFIDSLSPRSFSNAGGDRKNSDIIDVISQVVKSTSPGEVSMFVSDCVYSPESSEDIHKALAKLQTDMLNILKNKSKSDSAFGVLLYGILSDFHGVYYTKTNAHINCNGNRPYYVWFMGDVGILASVAESISKIMSDDKAQYIIGIPEYSYLPYKTIKSSHSYHYMNAKTNTDSLFTFSFVADMSYLPLSADYLLDKQNYECAKNKYFIKKIEPYMDPKSRGYNYKYTVSVRGGKNSFVTPTLVEISLKSMLRNVPQWVIKYDDPKGNDYNNGYDPSKLKTFGLRSLVEGIADYYKSPDYVTFKIKIN